ncbi:hypothetical protein H5T53_00040 [Candidatus Bipolaricaulota bacterium]|nr:hypothetical protein [Candidatus Bipolaricaulota bacterium]
MRKMFAFTALLLWAMVGLSAPELVLYSGGFGLVLETRTVTLAREGELALGDLPHTILLDSLTIDGLSLTWVEPRWSGGPDLAGLVGETVQVFAHGECLEGRLVGVTDGLVLATADGLLFLASYDRVLAQLPEQQAVRLGYRGATPGPGAITLRYLADGLAWRASYTAVLGEDGLVLVGMATLINRTGVDFPGAQVTLVAGDVYRPSSKGAGEGLVRALAMAPADVAVAPAAEYHRYDLPGPVDLPHGTALVPLVRATLAYTRAYRFTGGPVEVLVRFENTALPLPAGEVRTFDEGGRLFVGAAPIGHTPVGEKVELAVGAAFDLTGERVQEARRRLAEDLYRDTWRIALRSAKGEPVEVEVVETLPGTWTITESSFPYEQVDAQRVRFRVVVPAFGSAEVRYTVEWRY